MFRENWCAYHIKVVYRTPGNHGQKLLLFGLGQIQFFCQSDEQTFFIVVQTEYESQAIYMFHSKESKQHRYKHVHKHLTKV